MLSGNKYTSRSSLGSAIYQCLQQIPKEDFLQDPRNDDNKIHNNFEQCYLRNIILTWQTIHVKCQALFSLKKKSISARLELGVLRPSQHC